MPHEMRVVIATAGRPQLLQRTLRSLERCLKPREFQGVVVIENGPREGVEEVVRQCGPWMPARYQYVPTANKSLALNAALQHLDGDCLAVFADDDLRFDEQVLVEYARAAEQQTGAFFGGPFNVDYEVEPPGWLLRYLPYSAKGWRPVDLGKIEAFIGFNWAATVCHIWQAGGFRPEFGPGSPFAMRGQETEMQARLRSSGYRPVYVPGALVWHHVPRERCTAEWALQRAFCNAMYVGFQDTSSEPRAFGIPLRTLVKAALRSARQRALSGITSDVQRRFALQFKDVWARGLVKGYRIAHQVKQQRMAGAESPPAVPAPQTRARLAA